MGDEKTKGVKYDPNTEAFQMRAQWKKAEICKHMWHDRWSWMFHENKKLKDESHAIRVRAAADLPQVIIKKEIAKSLKPVPVTSTGFIGWIASKPDYALEIYTSWIPKIPLKQADAWDSPDYIRNKEKKSEN